MTRTSKQLDGNSSFNSGSMPAPSDVVVIGDTNLDEVKWASPDPINTDMVNLVKTRIETIGFQQLVNGVTRCWPNQSDSLIDKIWVNCPDKIAKFSKHSEWNHRS